MGYVILGFFAEGFELLLVSGLNDYVGKWLSLVKGLNGITSGVVRDLLLETLLLKIRQEV